MDHSSEPDHAHHTDHHAGHEMQGGQGADPKSAGAHAGHDRHAGHSVAMFRDKFWLSLALTLPVASWA